MKKAIITVFLALGITTGCTTQPAAPSAAPSTAPAVTETPAAPTSTWYVQTPTVSPIDGVRTQILSTEGNPEGSLVLTFDNGKLSTKHVGLRVETSQGIIDYNEYSRATVRVRFDDESPTTQSWGVTDSHTSVTPYQHEDRFLSQILSHKKLVVEYRLYERASQTATFGLTGLAGEMTKAGLFDPSEKVKALEAKEAAQAARDAKELARCRGLVAQANKLQTGTAEWAAINNKISETCGNDYL
jgi:hypothetical protein